MTFVGPPFTFKFNQLGSNCGLIAPHAAVDYDGRSVWMGYDNFYVFDGQVRNLPCTVRRFIFDRINFKQKDKIFAGINSEFKEIIWLYPSELILMSVIVMLYGLLMKIIGVMEKVYLQPLQIKLYLEIQ